MKISVDPKSFVEAVTWVTKGYDSKNPESYVALVIDKNGHGHLSHSSSTFMKAPVTVLSSDLSGKTVALAMEGQYLQRFAGALSGLSNPIDLSQSKDGSPLEAKTTNGKFTIPVLDKKIPADPKTVDLGDVDDHEWFDTLQRLSKLSESEVNANGMSALSAVDIRFDVENKKVFLMATDRYALAEVSVDFDPAGGAADYVAEHPNSLLPENNAGSIAPTKGLASAVTIAHDPKTGKFGYVFGDGRIALFSLVDAKALPYQRMKESAQKSVVNKVVLSLKDLKKAIQTVSNLAWNEVTIQFRITDKSLTVEDDNSSNKVTIDLESADFDKDSDNTLLVSFIRSIITESFNPITTDKISLSWKDASAAFTIGAVLDDGSTADNIFVLVAPKISDNS